MRKRDGSKMTRTERSSLIPAADARPSVAPPAVVGAPVISAPRNSMNPAPMVRGSLRIEAGWEELGTGSIPSMIPKAPPPPRFGANSNSMAPAGASLRAPPPAEVRSEPRTGTRDSWRVPAEALPVPLDSWRPPSEAPTRLPSWPPAEGLDADRIFRHALLLREQGNSLETLQKLEEVMRIQPEHAEARMLLHKLALELAREDLAQQHSEWLLAHHAKRQAFGDVCSAYRRTRMAFAGLGWSERALQQVVTAAERTGEPRVVLDATKLLLTHHPNSPVLAQALYTSARVQHNEGRPDLARTTLQNLIARFPKDPLAVEARRRLVEIGQ